MKKGERQQYKNLILSSYSNQYVIPKTDISINIKLGILFKNMKVVSTNISECLFKD